VRVLERNFTPVFGPRFVASTSSQGSESKWRTICQLASTIYRPSLQPATWINDMLHKTLFLLKQRYYFNNVPARAERQQSCCIEPRACCKSRTLHNVQDCRLACLRQEWFLRCGPEDVLVTLVDGCATTSRQLAGDIGPCDDSKSKSWFPSTFRAAITRSTFVNEAPEKNTAADRWIFPAGMEPIIGWLAQERRNSHDLQDCVIEIKVPMIWLLIADPWLQTGQSSNSWIKDCSYTRNLRSS